MALSSLLGILGVKLTTTGLAEFQGDMSKAAAATEAAARKQERALQQTARALGELANGGAKIQSLGTAITAAITLPILAAGVASTKMAVDWESAFTGVRKTVSGTQEQLDALGSSIRLLSTQQPTSANDLAQIAASAGQLGIARENVLGFTKVVADLSVTTNLTAEQGATDLARLANITQLPQDQFDRLASSVVALGNSSATFEDQIVAMTLRLAGAGAQVGLAQAETIGLAAALSSVGIEAEAGGSAFSRVIKDMAVAVAKGGKELRDFSDVAAKGGVANFAETFRRAPAEAIGGFIQGLINIKRQGGDVIALLDRMGITEIRMSDALLRTAGAGDLVARSIKTSTTAWRENTALTKEAETRYATTASQLQVLRNKAIDIAVSFGTALLPAIRTGIGILDALSRPLKFAAELFGRLPGPVQFVVVGAGLLVAAVGPLVFALGALINTTATASKTLIEFALAQRAAAVATRGTAAATATQSLGGAAGAVTGLRTQLGSLGSLLGSVASRFAGLGSAGAGALARIGAALPTTRAVLLTITSVPFIVGSVAAAAAPATHALYEHAQALRAADVAARIAAGGLTAAEKATLQAEVEIRKAASETGLFKGALIVTGDVAHGVVGALGAVADEAARAAQQLRIGQAAAAAWDGLSRVVGGAGDELTAQFTELYSVTELYGTGMSAAERSTRDMATASKLAGRAIWNWDEALQEIAKHSTTLANAPKLWAAGAPIDPERVKALVAQLGGAGLKTAVGELDAALRDLGQTGPISAEALAGVAKKAEELQQQGATLSPALLKAIEDYKKNLAEIALIGEPKEKKKGLGSEEQLKQLAQVRGELAKLAGAHKGAYAGALADVDAAIASRRVEAKGVSDIITLLERLRTAKKLEAREDFIRTQLGTVTGDAQKALRDKEQALLAQAGVSDQEILAGARLTQDVLERAVQAGQISQEQLRAAADSFVELRAKGADVPPVLQEIADTWRTTGGAFASGFDVFEAEAKKGLDALKLFGPTAAELGDQFDALMAGVTANGGLENLNGAQLAQLARALDEIAEKARVANREVPGLADAIQATSQRLSGFSESGLYAINSVIKPTIDWKGQLEEVAQVLQLVGDSGTHSLGRIVGALPAVFAGFERIKAASANLALDSKGGLFGGFGAKELSSKLALGAAVGQGLGTLSGLFGGADTRGGRAFAGAAVGAQLGSIAGPIGTAVGAGLGAAIKLFGGSPEWQRAGKAAAKVFGPALAGGVSKELGEKIAATSKQLGVSLATASLLNLSGVVAEAQGKGVDPRQFSGQVVQLLELASKGGKEAARALEEASKGFTTIAEAAQKAGTVGDASLRRILRSARELNQVTPEMRDYIRTQLESAASGITAVIGKFEVDPKLTNADAKQVGGLDLFVGAGDNWRDVLPQAEANAGALARRFAGTFWALVEEEGVGAAGKALGEPFAALKEQLTTVFPGLQGELGSLLAPVERLIDLSNNPLFSGANEAVQGLKANLEGLANTDHLQASDLADYGTLALATRDQMLAAGADSKTALQAVQPLLQSLISASQQYGTTLDANSQALVDQAKAEGLVFKTEPIERVAVLLESIARKLGAEIPAEARSGATATATSWDGAGHSIERSTTTASAAASSSFAAIPAAAGAAADHTIAVFDTASLGVAGSWATASGASIAAITQLIPAADAVAGSFDNMGQRATGWLDDLRERLGDLSKGVVVPINFAAGLLPDGGIPALVPPTIPPALQAARGAYVHGRSSGRGAFFEVGEPGAGDEIIAPVRAVLDAGARAAAGGGPAGVMGAVVAELQALRQENARMRDALARLGERPVSVNVNARLHADGRAIGDVVAEQIDGVGHERLGRALDRRANGRRGGS